MVCHCWVYILFNITYILNKYCVFIQNRWHPNTGMKQRTNSELLYSTNLQARSQTMPIGATKNFRGGGNSYWSPYSTNHRNHWQHHYYENGDTKQSWAEIILVFTPTVTFWGTLVANEVKKIFKWNLFEVQNGSLGQLPPVSLPGYVTANLYIFTTDTLIIKCSSHMIDEGWMDNVFATYTTGINEKQQLKMQ